MELSEYRDAIIAPVSDEHPAGERLIDDALFDFVEEQMMKVGSLSHATVQWHEVELGTLKLLREKSKDIKLLVYLLQCLHHQLTPARFITAFEVMTAFMEHYWEEAFPAPGARGNLPRRKFFSQILQRFAIATEKADFNAFESEDKTAADSALIQWLRVIEDKGLLSESVQAIPGAIKSELSKAEARRQTQISAPAPKSSPDIHSGTQTVSNSKQDLLKVAEFIGEQDWATPLSIRLRRYSVWGLLTSLPDHNHDGETQLRGMQPDRVKDYRDRLENPDLQLWRQIEQSLILAPFWFEGQWMSYCIAKKLDKPNWCQAISEEVQAFVARFPKLLELRFKGNEPFINEEVKQWLVTTNSVQAATPVSGGWDDKKYEALEASKNGGLAIGMTMLNDELANASQTRDKFYWRLLCAELLHESHYEAFAAEQFQTLSDQVSAMSVAQWEPSFIQRLSNNLPSKK